MSGIYIHIPFCKKACHYCDFHFSTSLLKRTEMVEAICQELTLRREETSEVIQTIYFGGGTPSLLTLEELQQIFRRIEDLFEVAPDAEITLEANPDDLSEEKVTQLQGSPVNRLSIGVQSFFEEDLVLMNRAHNASEALKSVQLAVKYFDNISIDLIYGIPGMSKARWKENLRRALELGVPHISSYALTVEPRTALKALIEKGRIGPVEEEVAKDHYDIMIEVLTAASFDNYEFSNFGKPGYFSRNNTAYWFGEPYLGIGPSAHSFDGKQRQWNISNNARYIKSINSGEVPAEIELLSKSDLFNELIMTRLRTKWGVSLDEVETRFGGHYKSYLISEASRLIARGMLEQENGRFQVSKKSKFLSDGIASELFYVES